MFNKDILELYLNSLNLYDNVKVTKILFGNEKAIFFDCAYKSKNSNVFEYQIFSIEKIKFEKWLRMYKLKNMI